MLKFIKYCKMRKWKLLVHMLVVRIKLEKNIFEVLGGTCFSVLTWMQLLETFKLQEWLVVRWYWTALFKTGFFEGVACTSLISVCRIQPLVRVYNLNMLTWSAWVPCNLAEKKSAESSFDWFCLGCVSNGGAPFPKPQSEEGGLETGRQKAQYHHPPPHKGFPETQMVAPRGRAARTDLPPGGKWFWLQNRESIPEEVRE